MADWDRQIGAMTLFVPDLDAAREFYAQAFGLNGQPMDENSVMLRFGEMFIFLRKIAAAAPPVPEITEEAGKGAGQFAIIVNDVDAVCAEIAGRGVRPLTGPADRDWGMRTATFADPAGHIWEIAQDLPGNDA
ncbi:MAG TPA: VOC family protein [Trebonia sp.]|jgi:catechol 2,3-dioxygenase-like lactoylglutathione lyase family enzyme|nr:VOC family protein [Trebonia sp.]